MKITESHLIEIRTITSKLKGQILSYYNYTYPSILCIHFGELTRCKPPIENRYRGEYELVTLATPWTLWKDRSILTNSSRRKKIQKIHLDKLLGLKVEEFSFLYQDGRIFSNLIFEEGYIIHIVTETINDPEISYWELHLPNNNVLKLGGRYPYRYGNAEKLWSEE